jgi:hypothetical protein
MDWTDPNERLRMTAPPPARPAAALRPWTVAAAASAVSAVAALTLAPRTVVAPVRALFERMTDAAVEGLFGWVPFADLDRVLNTLLFVPLGATLAVLVGRRLWPLAMLVGFAMSTAVVYAQAGIPGRVPDQEDVLWNTCGAVLGALAVGLVFAALRRARAVTRAVRRSGA